MFKVSFKGDFKKVQTFNNRATIVTMTGQMSIPNEMWSVFPDKVANWMWQHPSVDASWGKCTKENEVIRLEFSGKSVCAEEDTFDLVVGERIAEARAKIKLYEFMANLTNKIGNYYVKLVYGNSQLSGLTIDNNNGGVQLAHFKYAKLFLMEHRHLDKLLEEA